MTLSVINSTVDKAVTEPVETALSDDGGRRIVVLDGANNQALACVRSLGRAGHIVYVAGTTSRPLASWSNQCAGKYRLRSERPDEFRLLREWAKTEQIDLVLPLTERSCVLCNLERDAWGRAGIEVGCGSAQMLAAAFDKQETVELAQKLDVRTPPTRFPKSLEESHAAAQQIGYPCVVKPRFSHAWDEINQQFLPDRGVAYVQSPDELTDAVLTRRQGDHWPILQGYVEGRGKGLFALANHGQIVAWFAHERLRDVRPTGSGSSLRQSVCVSPRLQIPAERLLREMNWHGPAMVEFRDDGKSAPCLIEVNGRFWASLQLAIEAGVNFPRLWADVLSNRPTGPCPDFDEGVVLRWLWGDVKRFLYIMAGKPHGYPREFPSRWQGLQELMGPQPNRTRCEMWETSDRWPALGEWVQGIQELCRRRT